ncbi:MAG: hypothetical protein L0211_09155 [Planctomycetaceae bacterium]|nr:hypothetical protein [Planctomycetaceae bacterium]
MLIGGGKSGGGGRDVIFRLVAQADPAAKGVMKQWGEALAGAQKKATETARQENKKQADERLKTAQRTVAQEIREAQKRDQQIAQSYLKENLKAIDEKSRLEKRSEDELAKWKERVRRNSIQQEHKDNLKAIADQQRLRRNSAVLEQRESVRLAREQARVVADIQRQGLANENLGRLQQARRAAGYGHIVGGIGNIARGVAYSGLIGQENTQTVLNTVLGIEAAGSAYRGGRALVSGIGLTTGATGASALSAGAAIAAPATAAAAALTALVAAAASFTGFVRQATKHGIGGGADVGSLTDLIATKEVSAGASLLRAGPRSMRGGIGAMGTLTAMFGGVVASEEAAERVQAQGQARKTAMDQRAQMIGSLSQLRQGAIHNNLPQAQGFLSQAVGEFQRESAGGMNTAATVAAARQVWDIYKQVHSLQLDGARAQIEGARDQLNSLRQSHNELKQIADESKRAYQSDISRAASAKPEEIMMVREIARKQASGEGLTRTEFETASQFNVFKPFAESEAERRAKDFGLSDIFAPLKSKRDEDARKLAENAEQIAKAELTVKQQHEIILKLEGGSISDQAIAQIKELLDATEAKSQQNMIDQIRQSLVQQANARGPTR